MWRLDERPAPGPTQRAKPARARLGRYPRHHRRGAMPAPGAGRRNGHERN
ncbi:hypothetical protein CSC43_7044 [Pseudomonas aeruginosa]|nr:hypothetical protein CSC43_7044 [Pseudomonas aeruginosa]